MTTRSAFAWMIGAALALAVLQRGDAVAAGTRAHDDSSPSSNPQRGSAHPDDCDSVVARARKLLPRKPPAIVVVDADVVDPIVRRTMGDAEGFVIVGQSTVFLKKQGSTFQHALLGPGIWDYVLAIIIWHEMAHLGGADEREARRQEEALWSEFVVGRKVDSDSGLNYLRLLRARQ